MTITSEQFLIVVGGASTIASGIFWGAFLLGRLRSDVEDVKKGVIALDNRMDRAGNKMSDLADEIQKMPDRYLTRAEALHWSGSRSGDHQP